MGTMARPITAVVAIWSQVCREHALAQLRQAGVACETAALDPTLRSRIEAVDPGLLVIEGGSVPFDVVGLLRDLRRSTAVQSMPIILLVSYRFQYRICGQQTFARLTGLLSAVRGRGRCWSQGPRHCLLR
jgi:hypothetical protein